MLTPEERDEICATVETLRGELDDLVVRGLKAAGPDDLRSLEAMRAEFSRIGARHLADGAGGLVDAIRAEDKKASILLLEAQSSLRVFERVLTLDYVANLFDESGEPAVPKTTAVPPVAIEDAKKTVPTLEDLAQTVEDLVAAGLTTASEATRRKLDVSMKEALRLKLGRLGASLRFVNEEIGRFLAQDEGFSARRLSFFLNRSWILARGLARAIRGGDAAAVARLLLTPSTTPVKRLEAVCLGAGKRIVKSSASCAFEFRMRKLDDGAPLVWSCLFSYASSFPAEAFLHLPQPQKFLPRLFCEPKPLAIENAAVSPDGRIFLGPQSTVRQTEGNFPRPAPFDPAAAAARLRAHRPGPLDIEVELQEEVLLEEWTVGAPVERPGRADQVVYPVHALDLEFDAVVSTGEDGKELRDALDGFRKPKAKRPPLFGLVHYELCRLILQPLSVHEPSGPRHLMIAGEQKFDPKTLADLTRAIMNRR